MIRNGLRFHPLASVFPELHKWSPEFLALVEDVRMRGLLVPVTMFQGMVLDGRSRVRACDRAGVEITGDMRLEYAGNDPEGFVLSMNYHRRHLTVGSRAFIGLRRANASHGGDRRSKGDQGVKVSRARAAQELGVSESAIDQAAAIAKKCLPEIAAAVSGGKLPLGYVAREVVKMSNDEQRAYVASGFFRSATGPPRDPEAPKRKRLSPGAKTMIADFARWFDELPDDEKERVWRITDLWHSARGAT
jgi:hypothetical protein